MNFELTSNDSMMVFFSVVDYLANASMTVFLLSFFCHFGWNYLKSQRIVCWGPKLPSSQIVTRNTLTSPIVNDDNVQFRWKWSRLLFILSTLIIQHTRHFVLYCFIVGTLNSVRSDRQCLITSAKKWKKSSLMAHFFCCCYYDCSFCNSEN